MNTEEWRDIKGYEGQYQVSNLGRVKSFKIDPEGHVMVLTPTTRGYPKVDLSRKTFLVHRLVVGAFVGEIPEGMEVNHMNGIVNDNRLENLEIVTPYANKRHAAENNLREKARLRKPIKRSNCDCNWTLSEHIQRVKSKLPTISTKGFLIESDVRNIKLLLAEGRYNITQISRMYNVSRSLISYIKSGRRWNHVE